MSVRDSLLSSVAPIAAGELLVVADEATRKLVTLQISMLAMQASHALSGDRAVAIVTEKSTSLDCVIVDIGLAGLDAWALLKRLRQDAETATIPVMAILGRPPNESDMLKLIEAGVMDHIVKPLSPTLLCAKIKAVSERSRMQRELKNKLRFALEYSAHDALTGLYNRRYFERRLREESAHAKRHKRPFSLIVVDLDHFKLINDTYGHEDGDRVLCHVADLLGGSLREDDIACRFGGEEFVILLRATPGPAARVVANRLRAEVAAKGIPLGAKDELRHVTLSGGVSAADERNGYDVDNIVDRADKALYRAKRGGRNRVEME
ncbi:MAG: diguanylate cyclase [Labilithrix sp.]|nr:diguanylate cyclase [Labilithrix sp.]MBX3222756.1 diguanylate cyclase [Labilithrix sp.]